MAFAAGDWLVVPGSNPLMRALQADHHGLYVGGGDVVHWAAAYGLAAPLAGWLSGGNARPQLARIATTSLFEFAAPRDVGEIIARPHPPPAECLGRAVAVERARAAAAGGDGASAPSYNLLGNNCEDFVSWCVTGRLRSDQVDARLRDAQGQVGETFGGVFVAAGAGAAAGRAAARSGGAATAPFLFRARTTTERVGAALRGVAAPALQLTAEAASIWVSSKRCATAAAMDRSLEQQQQQEAIELSRREAEQAARAAGHGRGLERSLEHGSGHGSAPASSEPPFLPWTAEALQQVPHIDQ